MLIWGRNCSVNYFMLTLYVFWNGQDLSVIETEKNKRFYSKHTPLSPFLRFSVQSEIFCKTLQYRYKRHKKLLAIVSTFASREFVLVEVNKTKRQNFPILKNIQKFVKGGTMVHHPFKFRKSHKLRNYGFFDVRGLFTEDWRQLFISIGAPNVKSPLHRIADWDQVS